MGIGAWLRRLVVGRLDHLRSREFWAKVAHLAEDVLENRKTVNQAVDELIKDILG